MPWVKVCGLTREEDVAVAVEAGADALGFVVAERSPRRLDLDRARGLMDGAPALRIVVSVDATPEEVLEAASMTAADGVQPHGRYSGSAAALAAAAGLFVLRPVPVTAAGPAIALEDVEEGTVPLLDTADAQILGGTGRSFDWDLIGETTRRFVLAGGLGPDNVVAAIRITGAWGVDASSRLESAPGVKDPDKVVDFIEAAKGEQW